MRAVIFLLVLFPAACTVVEEEARKRRPNILLIVADDMGFTDLGAFGGEITTPNLDALAYAGLRFTNLHALPTCSPTRAALLTGVDPHLAGLGNMAEEMAPNQEGEPGYEGFLNDRVVTVASLLRDAGYRTYMTGKWHLGRTEDTGPSARGFERSFSLLAGGSHFADMRPAYAPTPDVKAAYRDGHELLDALPESFEYSSQFYVDRMIGYLEDDERAGEPFFAFLSFTAPHWPLQAPDAAIETFAGRYSAGYDVLFETRFRKLRELGLVPDRAKASRRPWNARPWDSLSEGEKRTQARAMEVYAAMVAELDRHTGRLIDYLKREGLFDDTVVIFLSDNGAEGHDLDATWPADKFPDIRRTIEQSHDFSFENMGRPGSYTLYGPGWAWAAAPTFRLYKAFPTEGGTRVASFVHFPKAFQSRAVSETFLSVKDVTPTLLDLAGVAHPGEEYGGRTIEPMTGRSMLPIWRGETDHIHEEGSVVVLELMGKIAVRKGRFKLVKIPPPHGTGDWELFDLSEDLAEAHDLSASHPDELQELVAQWEAYAAEHGVILPDWLSGY